MHLFGKQTITLRSLAYTLHLLLLRSQLTLW